MIRRTIILVALSLALLRNGRALAAPRYNEVEALPIYRRTVGLTSGAHTFSTANLQPNATFGCTTPDTFLVVKAPSGGQFFNDDCVAGSPASCLTASDTGLTPWTITVFAKDVTTGKACGFANVVVDGSPIDSNVFFGGSHVRTDAALAGTHDVQTVNLPGGADDTIVIAYSATYQELGYDNNSGTGLSARLQINTANMHFVVGSFSQLGSGTVALVLNECLQRPDDASPTNCFLAGLDSDSDNLSDALETELLTQTNAHDTDADGVFDYFEIYGRVLLSGEEQELYRYGSNPRRRDLFVELDREFNGTQTRNPPTEADVTTLETVYLDLPQLPANPDGTHLIQVHVDGGGPCPTRPTLCGDWGGSDVIQKPLSYTDNLTEVAQNIRLVRQGLFKYGYFTIGGGGTANEGSVFRGQNTCVAAHELGHTFGLKHWGSATNPAINLQPAYPSIMNYLFSYYFPPVDTQCGRFSRGNMRTLNPPTLEAGYGVNLDTRYLHDSPSLSYSISGWDIDFDRDGRFATNVSADSAPLNTEYAGLDWPDYIGRQNLSDGNSAPGTGCSTTVASDSKCHPAGGAGLTALAINATNSKLYAFVPFLHQDGKTYPDYASKFEGTLYGGSAWTNYTTGLSLQGLATGEASAVLLEAGPPTKILLLFPRYDGRLWYRYFDPNDPLVGAWQPVPNWPNGVTARSASFALDGPTGAGILHVVFRDTARSDGVANVYEAYWDAVARAWTSAPTLIPSISSVFTPGLVLGPNNRFYLATVEGTTGNRSIRLYSKAVGSSTWSSVATPPLSASLGGGANVTVTKDRLSLVFEPLRRGDGTPFTDGTGQLVVLWNEHSSGDSAQSGWNARRAQQQGYIAPGGTALFTGWSVRTPTGVDRPYPFQSVAVTRSSYEFATIYTASDFAQGAIGSMLYLPHVSGSIPGTVGLVDTNDAAQIGADMCKTLWALPKGADAGCFCATQHSCSGSGYVTFMLLDPPCDLPPPP